MNEVKEITQIESSAGEYTAPKVEVMEVKALQVMCTSSTSNEEYGRTNEDW